MALRQDAARNRERILAGARELFATEGVDAPVEEEAVQDVGLGPGATRRQVTTRGVRLNDLIGKRFRVGEVECYGVELCEPCAHLEKMTRPGIMRELVHRAGINADILTDGTISVGDQVIEL